MISSDVHGWWVDEGWCFDFGKFCLLCYTGRFFSWMQNEIEMWKGKLVFVFSFLISEEHDTYHNVTELKRAIVAKGYRASWPCKYWKRLRVKTIYDKSKYAENIALPFRKNSDQSKSRQNLLKIIWNISVRSINKDIGYTFRKKHSFCT